MTAFECIYDNADFQTVTQIKIPNILVACSDLATANLLLITVEISCIGKPEQLLAKKLHSGVPKYLCGALSKPRGFLPGKCYGRLLWLAWHESTPLLAAGECHKTRDLRTLQRPESEDARLFRGVRSVTKLHSSSHARADSAARSAAGGRHRPHAGLHGLHDERWETTRVFWHRSGDGLQRGEENIE